MSVQATNNYVVTENKVPAGKEVREFGVAEIRVNVVVSVGPEVEDFKAGDIVEFSGRDAVIFMDAGKTYTAVPYYAIVAKVVK